MALAVKPIAILSQHLKVAWHVSDFLMTQVTLSNVGGGQDVKNNFLSNDKHLLSVLCQENNMRKPPLASQDLLSNETERFRPMHHPASSGLMWLNIQPFPDISRDTVYAW